MGYGVEEIGFVALALGYLTRIRKILGAVLTKTHLVAWQTLRCQDHELVSQLFGRSSDHPQDDKSSLPSHLFVFFSSTFVSLTFDPQSKPSSTRSQFTLIINPSLPQHGLTSSQSISSATTHNMGCGLSNSLPSFTIRLVTHA